MAIGTGNNMSGMDSVIFTYKNNSISITDRFASGYVEPELDS